MSILIRGMEMPTEGGTIVVYKINGQFFAARSGKNELFPLVPVPAHGRLGDLDKLEQMFVDIDNAPYSGFDGSEPFYSAEDAAQIIRLSPTVIPATFENLPKSKDSQKIFFFENGRISNMIYLFEFIVLKSFGKTQKHEFSRK